jgi:hypothetical protein
MKKFVIKAYYYSLKRLGASRSRKVWWLDEEGGGGGGYDT